MGMRLKRDPDPLMVAEQIRTQVNNAQRFQAGVGNDTQVINDYVHWANGTQGTLLAYFIKPDLSQLFTQRYFHLHNLMHSTGGRRIPEMVAAEIEVQIVWLNDEATDLEQRAERFNPRGRLFSLAVPDAGMFLHGESDLARVPWSSYMDASAHEVRLVVPIRVIEELDGLKDSAPIKIKHRARIALRQLAKLLNPPNTPQLLAERVTIESFISLGSNREIPSGDSDILVACDEIESFSRHKLRVITRDLAMSLRVEVAGFEAFYIEPEPGNDG